MSGATEFTDWPSGDCKPILELGCTPQQAEARWRLVFRRERDDLDWYSGTHVYDENIGYIVMMRYENSPTLGIIVYVDSKITTVDALDRIRNKFDIKESDITWESTET